MFSKACEYGIRSTIYIAEQSMLGRRVSLKEVAGAIDSPEFYTSKILQQLSKSNIINSGKGPTGGFAIDNNRLDRIMLSSIVSAIDGDNIYKGCGLGLKKCSERMPCPVHDQFKKIRGELKLMLERTSVKELASGIMEGLTFLKR